MSYGCPVCNGLQALEMFCPQCNLTMSDMGRADDYLGPYSPYQPVEYWQKTHAALSEKGETCVHYLFCEACSWFVSCSIEEQLF